MELGKIMRVLKFPQNVSSTSFVTFSLAKMYWREVVVKKSAKISIFQRFSLFHTNIGAPPFKSFKKFMGDIHCKLYRLYDLYF